MKPAFWELIARRSDWQLAESFFNSVTRRIFATVGVDPNIEFVASDFSAPPSEAARPIYRTYKAPRSTAELVETILRAFSFSAPWRDLASDVDLAARRIDEYLARSADDPPLDSIEFAWP